MTDIDRENHETFLEAANSCQPGILAVAQHLWARGYPVRLNIFPTVDRTSRVQPYHDNGDLEISQRIEVKQISYPFTCREDWPFQDFLICHADRFDMARPRPIAYWIVNPALTHAGVVRASTMDQWYRVTRKDRRYRNYEQVSYACNPDIVDFIELVRSAS